MRMDGGVNDLLWWLSTYVRSCITEADLAQYEIDAHKRIQGKIQTLLDERLLQHMEGAH